MTFSSRVAELKDKGFFENIEISRGIEKESLRVKNNAQLSQSNHPKELGSPLTNKFITTDFSDCLLYTSPSPRDMPRSRMPSSA